MTTYTVWLWPPIGTADEFVASREAPDDALFLAQQQFLLALESCFPGLKVRVINEATGVCIYSRAAGE